jgi:hypothetical protein
MARKLKVYRTSAGGFFELAVAAPSMKAAADAWGADPDIFGRGYAEQTDDPDVVEAAMASPGVVLRRPVGSHGAFSEHAALPKVPGGERKASASRPEPKKKSSLDDDEKAKRKATLEREQERQALERRKREEAERERAKEQRERMIAKANAAFDKARARHGDAVESLTKRREELDRDAAREQERWDAEQRRHRDALRQAES